MAQVTGYTAERMKAIEDASIVNGDIDAFGHLILTRFDETTIDAGLVTQTPSGVLVMTASITAPSGWLLCDGVAVSRETYAALFAAIGTAYGIGDGSTTFNLPNLKGKAPVGLNGADVDFDALGKTGGAKTHVLTAAEMPSHTHTQNAHQHGQVVTSGSGGSATRIDYVADGTGFTYPQGAWTDSTTAINNNTGGGAAHNNMAPFVIVNYIIKI